jgi:hypothetical protein
LDASDYAALLEMFRCDESYDGTRGWAFTDDSWQWIALRTAARFGTIALWVSVGLALVAGVVGVVRRAATATRRMHVLAAVPMAIAFASFGTFTIFVAPLGDQYGI